MDGALGAPVSSTFVSSAVSGAIAPGIGNGGDNGTGFHSRQPGTQPAVDTQNQHTENVHTKAKLDRDDKSADVSPSLPVFQKWRESPFTGYVARNTSKGTMPSGVTSFKPVDRSNMGIPLNPFWIRNDTWSMQHEASIFAEPPTYFEAPRVMGQGAQSKQNLHRTVYMDNLEQPQQGSGDTGLGKGSDDVPLETGAGGVTGVAEAAPQGEMSIEAANPAKTEAPEGSPDSKLEGGDSGVPAAPTDKKDVSMDDKKDTVKSEPPKKKQKVSRVKAQNGSAKKDPEKRATAE